MKDHHLEASLACLETALQNAVSAGKKEFSIPTGFFDGVDRDQHINAFLGKYPVRLSSYGPFEIVFEVRENH